VSAIRYQEQHLHLMLNVRLDDETPQSARPVTIQITNIHNKQIIAHATQAVWLTSTEARAVAAALIASADEADEDKRQELADIANWRMT
jgi:predicted transcriptional regulator